MINSLLEWLDRFKPLWEFLTGVGTLLIAVLAIWGDAIRELLVGPRITLELFDPQGEKTNISDGTPSRWYHVRVANRRQWARARNVRVVLTKVSRPASDGVVRPTSLSGPIQLTWQHGHSVPQYLTIGPAQNADLGVLMKGNPFILTPHFIPNNLDPQVRPGEKIVVEVLALSDETQSKPLCVEIAWDGRWSEDTEEMRHHLVVKKVACL